MKDQSSEYSRIRQKKIKKEFHKKKSKHFIKIIILTIIISIMSIFILGGLLFFYYARNAPKLQTSKLASPGSTIIYDNEGQKITSLGADNRILVSPKNVPQQLKNAIVSIEDKRFYRQDGIDPYRIFMAFLNNLNPNSGLQGGSTLDQQLIKLSYFSTKKSDQTLKRKAQDAWLAIQLDKKYSKNQILTFYINKVFMGYNNYGMQTASNFYYGKKLNQLNLAQTALIAGIPNAPSSYNPYANPKLALERRNEVLEAMYNNNKITKTQEKNAEKESIDTGLLPPHKNNFENNLNAKIADPYIKEVIQEAENKGYNPFSQSLKIYTNLNMKIQKQLYNIANTNKYILYPNNKIQVASTVVNPNNGKIIAMIGGRKMGNVTYGLNRAVQTDRTNGSCAKPILDYGPAIEYKDWATYHMLKDEPYIYPGTNINLYDWDHKYEGNITMVKALVESRNIPAIRTLSDVGIKKASLFAKSLGFNTSNLTYQNGIGLPSSTLQNAAAYAAFANGGIYYKPYYINKIQTQDGTTRYYTSYGQRVMKPSTAYMITNMLEQVIDTSDGTGQEAYINGLYQAGKTGTNAYPKNMANQFPSNAIMDSWFNGYTKNYSVSVWIGYDHQYQYGNYMTQPIANLASIFYKDIMEYMSLDVSNTNWTKPNNVYIKYINGIKYLYLPGSQPPSKLLLVSKHKAKNVPSKSKNITKKNKSTTQKFKNSSNKNSSVIKIVKNSKLSSIGINPNIKSKMKSNVNKNISNNSSSININSHSVNIHQNNKNVSIASSSSTNSINDKTLNQNKIGKKINK